MEDRNNFHRHLVTHVRLADAVLQTNVLHLDRRLVFDEGLDYTLVPRPLRASYEELFFGGILFDCDPLEVYEIRTAFHVFFAAVQLSREHGFVLLGPYIAENAPVSELDDLLVQNHVPVTEKDLYLHYLQTLPVLSQHKIKAFFNAFLLPWRTSEITALRHGPELTAEHPAPCPVFEEDSTQARADMLAVRYQREQEFLTAVAQGDFRLACNFPPIDLNRLPNKLRNDKNQMIVLNTLLRKAIESAKVHPYYIDQISAKWAVRIEGAATLGDVNRIQTELVEDYCLLVRRYSLAEHSPSVRAMINFVNFNLSNPALTLQMISDALDTSHSHLSRQFNKEMGKSLPEYIKEQRVAQAKHLLSQGDALSIAQVATAVGFADTNYFTKVFRQCTGITPTVYRANPLSELGEN